MIDKCKDIDKSQKNLLAAGRYECKAGDIIDFPVYLYNNTGYANAGIRFVYDAALTPLIYAGDNSVRGNSPLKAGVAVDSLTPYGIWNPEYFNVSIGTSSWENETDSGLMLTIRLQVPSDAEPGTVYPMKIEVDKLLDRDSQIVSYSVSDGWIHIYDGTEYTGNEITAPAATVPTAPARPVTTTTAAATAATTVYKAAATSAAITTAAATAATAAATTTTTTYTVTVYRVTATAVRTKTSLSSATRAAATTAAVSTSTAPATQPALRLNASGISLTNGGQFTIHANRTDVTFRSNNPDVAIVSQSGVVTAVGVGEAIITAYDSESNAVQLNVYVSPVNTGHEVPFRRGDVNVDGEVSIDDVQTALKAYTEQVAHKTPNLTAGQRMAADINGDGELTVEDVQYILIYYTENNVAGKHLTWEDIMNR